MMKALILYIPVVFYLIAFGTSIFYWKCGYERLNCGDKNCNEFVFLLNVGPKLENVH